MSLGTSLYDSVPTRLRGLAFLSLSDTGHVLTRTMVDSRGTVMVGGTWGGSQGTVYFPGTGTAGTFTGGQVETFTAGTAIPCRVDPMGGEEGTVANRIDERTTHRITVPPQTVVSARDRFSTTAGTYEITAVRTRTQEPVRILEATEDF
jgi:hypothetical protein